MLLLLIHTYTMQILLGTLDTNDTDIHFQYQSMMCLTGANAQESPYDYLLKGKIVYKSKANTFEDVCTWRGVQCGADGVVGSIKWVLMTAPMVWDLSWFPTHVHTVKCDTVSMNTTLQTRLLPRHIEILSLNFCGLRGTIELRTLPASLAWLSLQGNDFVDSVWLAELPPRMKEINIRFNRIQKVILSSEEIPKGIRVSMFSQNDGRKASLEWLDDTGEQSAYCIT